MILAWPQPDSNPNPYSLSLTLTLTENGGTPGVAAVTRRGSGLNVMVRSWRIPGEMFCRVKVSWVSPGQFCGSSWSTSRPKHTLASVRLRGTIFRERWTPRAARRYCQELPRLIESLLLHSWWRLNISKISRSWVVVFARHLYVVTAGKLFTRVPVTEQYNWYQLNVIQWCASPVSVASQCKQVSDLGLLKRISVSPSGLWAWRRT